MNDKVTAFPKVKKQTPEDLECIPMMHMCIPDDATPIYNFKWMIHLNGKGLHFLCDNCGTSLTLEEIMNAYEEDE